MKKRTRKEKRSDRNIRWIEEHCRVPEGRLVGKPVKIYPPQRQIMRGIFDSPTRRAIISFAKKNGKTTFAACILLLYLVGPESEPNSQLCSTGQSREQAAVIFSLAAKMVRMNPDLRAAIVVRDHEKQLYCPERGTLYRALSAEASTSHGLSPRVQIHDELGQVRGPRSELHESLSSATAAHENPIEIDISTQAPTDADLFSLMIDDAKKGGDPLTKLFLWEAPSDADPFTEETWRLANPLYDYAMNKDVIRELSEGARRMPSKESAFRNLNLNQRVDATSTWVSQSTWKSCSGAPDPDVLVYADVFAGLDLSARNDLTALWWMAPDKEKTWHVWAKFWAPAKGLLERVRRDRVPYDVWVEQGWITLTQGASVAYEQVAEELAQLCDDHRVVAVGFDRWRIDILKKELERLGLDLPLVEHGQGYRDMSPALDAMESALLNGQVRHGNNPVLTMCAANAVTTSDPAGNRKLDKARARGRIDGLVAGAMAFGVASKTIVETKRPSVYEQGVI